MKLKKIFLPLALMGLMTIGFTSCKEDSSVPSHQKQSADPVTEAELAQQDTIHIQLQANDKMQFDTDQIVGFEGQTIVLTLNHTGTMPKTSMGHNFVLIDNSLSVSQYAKLALKAKDNEYIPEDSKLTIAHTPMIGGGESAEITFQAPSKGTYDFLCSFPGHYSIMKGKFIIK